MAKKNPILRQCGLTLCAWIFQGIVATFCVLIFLYLASLILQPLQLVGITNIPPGIAYWNYKDKSYQETLALDTQARF
jgi:hypothetical protein